MSHMSAPDTSDTSGAPGPVSRADAQREAILLRYNAELGYREIADMLGAPEPTIRSRVFSGFVTLRKLLKSERFV